ncbi:MAG: hypothetical protein KDC92_16100, partial [Bacteroidetes bacterium]|nr:hypothetical protein [Bacteroidota bacterium]
MKLNGQQIQVFTNPHRTWDEQTYLKSLRQHKELNQQFGFDGTLLFTSHNDLFDPWVNAQWICE